MKFFLVTPSRDDGGAECEHFVLAEGAAEACALLRRRLGKPAATAFVPVRSAAEQRSSAAWVARDMPECVPADNPAVLDWSICRFSWWRPT